MTYQIEKNVPLPPKSQPGRKEKYPFREMEVGDSFLVTDQKKQPSVTGAGKKYGMTFVSRTVVEGGVKGYRVWRTA